MDYEVVEPATANQNGRHQDDQQEQTETAQDDRVIVYRANPDWRDFAYALDEHGIRYEHDQRTNKVVVHWDKLQPYAAANQQNMLPNGGFFVSDHISEFVRLEFGRLTVKQWENREGEIQRQNFVIGTERWHSFLCAYLMDKGVDYFKQWIESLQWDGKHRLNGLLVEAFEKVEIRGERNPKTRATLAMWASRATILGAVERTYDPGAKMDTMPVLVGDQGIGKSTIYREAFPKEWQRYWYRDNISLSSSKQKLVEEIGGGVIVEASEMSGMTKKDIGELKAMLTSPSDSVRMAYARYAVDVARQYVMVGTTNESEDGVLPYDTSGNRRFLPIYVSGNPMRVIDYMNAHRDQLWAEAKAMYDNGERAYMPYEFEQAAKPTLETEMLGKLGIFGQEVIHACHREDLLPDVLYTLQEVAQIVGVVEALKRPGENKSDNATEKPYDGYGDKEGEYQKVSHRDRRPYLADLKMLKWERKVRRRNGVLDRYAWFEKDNPHCGKE